MPLLILFIVVLAVLLIKAFSRPKVVININVPASVIKSTTESEQIYYNGPVPSKAQQEVNKKAIYNIIEQFPNGVLAERNPEYVEEYLSEIDLNLPPGIHTEK